MCVVDLKHERGEIQNKIRKRVAMSNLLVSKYEHKLQLRKRFTPTNFLNKNHFQSAGL